MEELYSQKRIIALADQEQSPLLLTHLSQILLVEVLIS